MFAMSLSTGTANAQNFQNIIGGLINSAIQANNQAEWRKLPELKRQCLLAASQSNIRFQQALQQGAISPLDPRIAPLRAKCDEIVDRPMRKNFECTFQQPGQSITTYCDEFYAQKGQDGSLSKLSTEEVIRLAASGQPISTAQFERQDALARRGQMATAGVVSAKVVSPSFNCANAKSQSELAICSSYPLSELDSRYGEYFAKSRAFDRKGELRKQLVPINKRRQECQGNTGCIKEQLEAGIGKVAAVLAQNGVSAPTIAELDKAKVAEAEQARKVIAEREQAARETARIAREAKEAQDTAKREDDERRLAIARAEAEKAKAEREKAQALAQVEIEKAKAAAQVEAEKAKAKAAAEAAQAKADADQKRAQAEAERAKAEAEKAKIAKEEEDRKNSWSGKISGWFGGGTQSDAKQASQLPENGAQKHHQDQERIRFEEVRAHNRENVKTLFSCGIEAASSGMLLRNGGNSDAASGADMIANGYLKAAKVLGRKVGFSEEQLKSVEVEVTKSVIETVKTDTQEFQRSMARNVRRCFELTSADKELSKAQTEGTSEAMKIYRESRNREQTENRYVAYIQCGMRGQHLSIMPCFIGSSRDSWTSIEIRNGDNYQMYKGPDVTALGRETRDGVKLDLKIRFSIRMQNASDRMLLTLKVVDPSTGNVLFTKSADTYGVIGLNNDQ
ncbi:MAG: hypothetical protein BGP08_04605 [Rhizobiales bacterium 64-17]|nr:MAG: hypothetical protein BGP08_04605 [Rhizobiales bacterium 64-17]